MAHPLDGCWAKIERANEHIQYLDVELKRFLDANLHRYRAVTEIDPKTLNTSIVVYDDGMEQPPPRFSIIIGEVLHHLRSSLDHLVWALALERHTNPSYRIAFPICSTPAQFEKALKDGIVKGVSGSAVALIKSVQPYREREPRQSALYKLHTLNVTEKHKLLIVVFGAVRGAPDFIEVTGEMQGDLTITVPTPDKVNAFVRPTKEGTKFHIFALNRKDPDVKFNLNVPCTVALDDPGLVEPEVVIPCLTHLRDATVQTLELFRGEF